ncbi:MULTISPECIES: hypothetical protein [unclassified Thioalkalivibrio]|uniref:hypothetical protein n=1 Tax=unclassified Thioalkalivibrio TaxID=2621013 RepID=UPI00035C9193|nr:MULTISPECIES: hypothetical protein [unclassified Thioalkalivibrio]
MSDKTKNPGFPEISTERLIEYLWKDLMIRAHTSGADPEWDRHIEDVWKAKQGTPYFERKVIPTYARGFPGMGKTTAFLVAAKEVADDLGMNLVENPDAHYKVQKNDLVVVLMEMAGEVSNSNFKGPPRKHTLAGTDKEDFTKTMPSHSIGALKMSRLGVLLLDDFANATPSIQNTALPVLQMGRSVGMDLTSYHDGLNHVLGGLTGNLGALDGTHTATTSSALATRVRSFMVRDTLKKWHDRTIAKYNDRIADAGYCDFLQQNPELFHRPDTSKAGLPYPNSRTHSDFLEMAREVVFSYEYEMEEAIKSQKSGRSMPIPTFEPHLQTLEELGSASLGVESGRKLRAFYSARMTHAAPLAKELAENGELSKDSLELLQSKWGNEQSADEKDFGYAFFGSLSRYMAPKLAEAWKSSKETGDTSTFDAHTRAISHAMYDLAPDKRPLGYFSTSLAERMVRTTDAPDIIGHNTPAGPVLNQDMLVQMVRVMSTNDNAHIAANEFSSSAGENKNKLIHTGFIDPISLMAQMSDAPDLDFDAIVEGVDLPSAAEPKTAAANEQESTNDLFQEPVKRPNNSFGV